MTARTVVGRVLLPDGTVPTYATVMIELVAATSGRAIGWVPTADLGVGGRRALKCDGTGAWTADLRPNSLIVPAGSVYRLSYSAANDSNWSTSFTISVPDSAGPHRVEDILVDPPATLPTAALTAHIADTTAAHAASAISFAPTGTTSATTVQDAIDEVAAEALPLAAVPTAGVAGQVLTKTSATNYATAWRTPTLLGPHFVVIGAEESERFESWPWLAMLRSGGRMTLTQHLATYLPGTAAGALALLDNYLTPVKPAFVVLEFGFRDLLTLTVPQFAADMQALVELTASRGVVPVLTTVIPRAAADGDNTSTFKARAAAASMWLKNYAALAGYPLIDFYSGLVDPLTGSLRAEYATSFYPAVTMYRAAADIAIEALSPYLRPWQTVEATYDGDPNNLIPTAFSLPDSNADGVPNGWSTSEDGAGTTFSIVTDARFKGGKAIQIAASAPATNRAIATPNLNASGTAVSAGDVCAVTFSYSVESSSGLSIQPEQAGFGCWVQMPASWQFFAYHQVPYDKPDPVRYTAAAWQKSPINRFSGLVYFPVNGDPAGWYNRSNVALLFRFLGLGAGAMTVRFGDLGFYNLTKLGATHLTQAVGSWNWVNSYSLANYWPQGS